MIRLRSVLRLLNPATNVEIVDGWSGGEIIYRGFLLNLSYCEIEEKLDFIVTEIRIKNEEHGAVVVIKTGGLEKQREWED